MKNYTTPATMTAAELNEMRKECAAEIRNEERAAAETLETLRALDFDERKKKAKELFKIHEEHTKKSQKIKNINAILNNNYRVKRFEEIKPAILATLQKYAGKPYGEKTAEKIKAETFAAARVYVYIERFYSYSMTIQEARADGCTDPNGEKWKIYQNNGGEFLTGNKINAPAPSVWYISGARPYAENPAELVATLEESREKARNLAEELRAVCNDYNKRAPEGIAPLDPSRI